MSEFLNRIVSKDLLIEQANELRKKHFRPGFDHMDARAAAIWLEVNYERFVSDVLEGRYQPMPALGFYATKTSGGYRKLARLTAVDTILQMSVLDVVAEYCDTRFSNYSFAYRRGRGVGDALRLFISMADRYSFAAKIDVVSCFDSMDWGVLEKNIDAFFDRDRKLTALLMQMAKIPVLKDRELQQRQSGVVQGAPVSSLLCNLYFHELDKMLEEKGISFIRYADDIVLFGDTAEQIHKDYEMVCKELTVKLRLQLNRYKCVIDPPEKLRYLGYRFRRGRHGMIALESAAGTAAAYYRWNESDLRGNKRRFDILSDGILRQHGFSMQFESESGKASIPCESTDIINVYSSVILDSGFLNAAFRTGTVINVFDQQNHLLGSFIPNAPLRSPKLTHRQLIAYYDEDERTALAKEFVRASAHNAVLNIRYYHKQRPDLSLEQALSEIKALDKEVRKAESVPELLILEARIRERYYGCYDAFLRSGEFVYEKRTRRPPQNEFNTMLSFGNTVLYNLVAAEINKTALDVRVGFLHATNRRLQSLNLDIAEVYRPLVVDRTIFTLINRGVIRKEHFSYEGKAVFLNEEGKRMFLEAFYDKLDTALTIKGEQMTYLQLIREEVAGLVRHFRKGTPYKPFKQVR